MKFKHYGKSCQMVISSAQELPDILALDDSHWAVTSAPKSAYKCDTAFLDYLDSDANGRIRSDEIRAAVAWCLDTLSNTSSMDQASPQIATDDIRRDSADGASLLITAAYVSEQMKTSPAVVTLEQVRTCMNDLRMKPLNGDGVIVPEAASDTETASFISAAIAATGGCPDLSGQTGLAAEQLAVFKTAIADFVDWTDKGSAGNSATMPLGADSQATWELLQKYASLIDHFFMLANFRNFDPENAGRFLAAKAAADNANDALNFAPLARPDSDGRLPLSGPNVNPLYQDDIVVIREKLFAKTLGVSMNVATQKDWLQVKSVLAPYGAYLASKKGGIVETLPLDKLRIWNDSPGADRVSKLIEDDREVARRVSSFCNLEKLILYQANLIKFANNFVSLSEFYAPHMRSMFERGSAVVDGRWFNFAIETADPAAHSAVAKVSGLFTFYLKVEPRNADAVPFTVAIPATAGTRGNLSVGKRGVFFDINGTAHDAIITQIIENPISLREAMLSPFVKIGKMVMSKIEGLSTAAEAAILKKADKGINAVQSGTLALPPPPPPAAPASPSAMLMSISISIAALGSAFAVFAKTFGGMSPLGRLYGAVAAVAVVLLPIMIGGIIKLSGQDLSAILEGCGWAVNQRMRLTRTLRKQFTERRAYPTDAEGTPQKRRQKIILAVLLALLTAAIAYAQL